jgi:hypothetical protein
MANRCLQFTYYIDTELEKAGFPKIKSDQKLQTMKSLDLGEIYEKYGESY